MPRRARHDPAGGYQLVLQRSAAPRLAFPDDASCTGFIELLAQLPRRHALEIHAYALLPDRYLVLLRSLRGQLGDGLRWLDASHARAHRERAPAAGPLWQARPQSCVVVDDEACCEALCWVHLAPLRARLVRQVGRAAWTSHAFYAGTREWPPWLRGDALLALCGGRAGYRRQLRALQDVRAPQAETLPPRLQSQPSRPPVQDLPARPTVDLTPRLEQVMAVTGARPDELRAPLRGRRGNRARGMAAWWLFREGQVRQAEVGRALGMSAGAVAKAVHDVERRQAQDAELAEWARNLVALRELRVGLER